jgi:PAS domain-containing protein
MRCQRLRRADGEYRWCIDAASSRRGANGEFLGYIGSVIDITERKATEQALRAAHDTFRHLVDRSPFGIYVVDADFRLVQVSEGAQNVFKNVHPLIGRDFSEVLRIIWPEPFATEAVERFQHVLATGEPYQAPRTLERRADTDAVEAYDWKIERVALPDGRLGAVCHFYDLTERQAHQDKIGMLMREVNHRAKNMLALVNAVAKQTAASGPDEFLDRFSSRVRALAANQDLLVQTDWDGAI